MTLHPVPTGELACYRAAVRAQAVAALLLGALVVLTLRGRR